MESGRVGACHKLESKRRKFLMAINDVVKSKYDAYAEYIKNTHLEAEHNFEKSSVYVRRALVRQKVLQKCMKMRRHNIGSGSMFGRYEGKPIESFGRDIESFITYNHPKMRRKRYLHKLLDESLEKGAILKENTVKERIGGWMERSYTKYKLMKAKHKKSVLQSVSESDDTQSEHVRKIIPKLPVLSNPFYSSARDVGLPRNTDRKTEANVLKLTNDMGKVEISTNHSEHLAVPVGDLKASQRPTLVLPPIRSSRDMIAT